MQKLFLLISFAICISCSQLGVSKVNVGAPIYLSDDAGLQLLKQSSYKDDYWRLSTTLVTQQTQSMCSIASSVTVLNALSIEKPQTPIYYPYEYYTQESFSTAGASAIVKMQDVLAEGMTLVQLENSLNQHDVSAVTTHASDSDVNAFRALLKTDLMETASYIIANYHRINVGQIGGGHFSPIAAFHEGEDRVLILDVARFKYSPAWIKVEDLFKSMSTMDSASGGSRGWIRVTAKAPVNH